MRVIAYVRGYAPDAPHVRHVGHDSSPLPDYVYNKELESDDGLIKCVCKQDQSPAQHTIASGVYHLLVNRRGGVVATFSGRYIIERTGLRAKSGQRKISFSKAVPEDRAPVQDGMPHSWLAQLTSLPDLLAPAPQQVAALKAQRRDLQSRSPLPHDAVADLSRMIGDLDPHDTARASRAAVTLRAVHMAQFIQGVRFTVPGMVDLQGRPHPDPVTFLQFQGKVAVVLSSDGQGMSLDNIHLRRALVVEG